MAWIFEPAVKAFEQYRADWDELNAANTNQIVLDSLFVQGLLRHFGTPHTVLGISTDREFPGMWFAPAAASQGGPRRRR